VGLLPCLGVWPAVLSTYGYVNRINPNSVYGKLQRPAMSELPCRISAKTKDAQALVMKFWNGDFGIQIEKYEEVDGKIDFTMIAHACLHDKKEPIATGVKIALVGHEGAAEVLTNVGLNVRPFLDGIDEETLGARIFHLFIRQNGFLFPWKFLQTSFLVLNGEFGGSKQWLAAMLDVRMIQVDLMLNLSCHNPDDIYSRMFDVSTALSSCKRFEEAGWLCNEIARGGEALERTTLPIPTVYAAAGCALRLAKRTEESLEIYIKSLCKSIDRETSGWALDDGTEPMNQHVLSVLATSRELDGRHKLARRGVAGYLMTSEEKLYPTLLVLLSLASFKTNKANWDDLLRADRGPWKDWLKPWYRASKGAKQILMQAFECTTLAGFTEKLLSALQFTDISGPFIPLDFIEDFHDEGYAAEGKKAAKKSRKFLKHVTRFNVCENCNKNDADEEMPFKYCPCNIICYCSKSCQKEDWKKHKIDCTWHAARMNSQSA